MEFGDFVIEGGEIGAIFREDEGGIVGGDGSREDPEILVAGFEVIGIRTIGHESRGLARFHGLDAIDVIAVIVLGDLPAQRFVIIDKPIERRAGQDRDCGSDKIIEFVITFRIG